LRPDPLFSVPRLRSSITFSTFREADFEYFRAMISPFGFWNRQCNRWSKIPFRNGPVRQGLDLPV